MDEVVNRVGVIRMVVFRLSKWNHFSLVVNVKTDCRIAADCLTHKPHAFSVFWVKHERIDDRQLPPKLPRDKIYINPFTLGRGTHVSRFELGHLNLDCRPV